MSLSPFHTDLGTIDRRKPFGEQGVHEGVDMGALEVVHMPDHGVLGAFDGLVGHARVVGVDFVPFFLEFSIELEVEIER